MPGEEVWLVGERRSTGEQKYYVSNLPSDTSLKILAATIKARWICEQAHQQLKEELGLDRFEGRSWTGLHRHALMTMIAYAFLQSRRLKAAGRKIESEDHLLNRACQLLGKRCCEIYCCAEHDRAAIITGGNSSPVFQSAKHDFDTIAPLVSTFVILDILLAVFAPRDAALSLCLLTVF